MKNKLFLYFAIFILSFSTPIIIEKVYYKYFKQNSRPLSQRVTNSYHGAYFYKNGENIPLTTNHSLPHLSSLKNPEQIEQACSEKNSSYENKNRFQWAQLFTDTLQYEKSSKFIATIQKKIWFNLSLSDKKIIAEDLFFCTTIHEKTPLPLTIKEADSQEVLATYSLKKGFKQFLISDFSGEENLN